MPPAPPPRKLDTCARCRRRFAWHRSDAGLCYWCDQNLPDRAINPKPPKRSLTEEAKR